MDWQLTATYVLVFLSSCYLIWRGWKLWNSKKKACASGCACSSSSAATPENEAIVAISLDKLTIVPKRSPTD